MEEWVGERWHRFIWRAADTGFAPAAVPLAQAERAVQLLFRAGGGDPLVRVTGAAAQPIGGPRSWLQRVAGQGARAALGTLDAETLALPPVIDRFPERQLNRDLYLWLAAQGACHQTTPAGWLADNLAATQRALQRFAGLRSRYVRLLQAHLARRPAPAGLHGAARAAEQAVQDGLRGTLAWARAGTPELPAAAAAAPMPPTAVAPVWLWLQSVDSAPSAARAASEEAAETPDPKRKRADKPVPHDRKRRRATRSEDSSNKNGLVLFFRAESILSWSEYVRVNRTGDDEDDQDCSQVADDLAQLHLAHRQPGETLAARIRFDLDLPSAAADDLPVGEGEPLPEWDCQRGVLLPARCSAQRLRHRPGADEAGGATDAVVALERRLQRTARSVRRRFEALRAAPRWQHGLTQGDELDLDAWVRFQADRQGRQVPRSESPAIFARRARSERSLASVMLADLSLSTDAYATPQARVIDLVRDSLFVFGHALDSVGDPFEMLGFSSVRRALRVHELKRFGERWDGPARERVAAIKPGFYTRMGAAIRYGTQRLAARPERQKLLLLLSDGKPNDLDQYEGRYGLEDTRQAVLAARAAGLVPFCVTIDQQAHAYLPRLFGAHGFALVHRPEQLARALTQVYLRLTGVH